MADYTINKLTLPMIALRGLWIYPHMIIHFDVGREKSVNAVEASLEKDSQIFLVSQKRIGDENPKIDDLYSVGVTASIKQTIKLPNGSIRVLVEGNNRAKLKDLNIGDYPTAELEEYIYEDNAITKDISAAIRLIKSDILEYEKHNKSSNAEILLSLNEIEEPGRLVDTVASYVQLELQDQMKILCELDIYQRIVSLHEILVKEIELLKVQEEIDEKVKDKIDSSQKEYYLREQLDAIKEELGDKLPEDEIKDDYISQIEEREIPDYVLEILDKEIDRLDSMNPSSPELNVSRTYIEYILSLPWGEYSDMDIDLKEAEAILNKDHYGMDDAKDRILEYVAVMEKTGKVGSQILCFVGPPGVGKTSISRSISKALGREFVSMRLGGVRDEAEIRGHRKTYVGSMPGKIVKLMIDAESMNPVFLLDEIDKLSSNYTGDPSSALLEVLDPEQNDEFRDHYLDFPLDLSEVMFITTANSLSTIPSALLDRMEVIELEGYTYEEKFNIAKKHLIPKVFKDHGIENSEMSISDAAVKSVIENYTRESGVRQLERTIAKIARRAVRKMLEEDIDKVSVSMRNLTDFAGEAIYLSDDNNKNPMVGAVTGLAWTQVGGVILNIEANVMPGTSKLQLTGQLGDVMKESASAGLSFIRSNYESLGLEEDFYKDIDIHIHVPEGATPKDGPSAGITMTTAMVSALTGKKVRSDVAMTGEITLTGRVLPIGGVKEKLLAAKRNGIYNIIFPLKNKRDVNELKESEIEDMNIKYVENIKEVLDLVFI